MDDYADMISVLAAICQAVTPGDGGALRPGLCCKLDRHRPLCRAVEAAQQADVAVVVGWTRPGWCRTARRASSGDSAHLTLPGVQQELVEAVLGTACRWCWCWWRDVRTPSPNWWRRRPLSMRGCPARRAPALAEIPFGDVNPGGRPITVPLHVGQVPYFLRALAAGRTLVLRPLHRREQRTALPLRLRPELYRFCV
ncbi:MAG: glycoside hydrolase family 3 C-terminal domain-containing protein [Caldilineaceae bacterium]